MSKRTIAPPNREPLTLTIPEVRTLKDAPRHLRWFAVGNQCWARSLSAEKALRLALATGGRGTYRLHLVNEEARVHPVSGALHYDLAAPGIAVNFAIVTIR